MLVVVVCGGAAAGGGGQDHGGGGLDAECRAPKNGLLPLTRERRTETPLASGLF